MGASKNEPLGEGGQSKVYLVRTPERTKERKQSLEAITNHVWILDSTDKVHLVESRLKFIEAIRTYTRADKPNELGAMEEFKIRDDAKQSLDRLNQEIEVLKQILPGLPKLLGFDMKNGGWSRNISQTGRWKIILRSTRATRLSR